MLCYIILYELFYIITYLMLVSEYSCVSKLVKRNCTEIEVESSQNLASYINRICH